MRLGSVTKRDKRNRTTSKKLTMTYQKVYFLKLDMYVYLWKFEVSSIILTSLRQEGYLPPPPQNEPLKNPSRLGLI